MGRKLLIYFLHLLLLLESMMVSGTRLLPDTQYNALFSLYSSTGGLEWRWKSVEAAGNIWNFSSVANSDPCQDHWQGVTCSQSCYTTKSDCSILSLSLEDYNMNGKLPQDLGNLINLESLILNDNKLYGELPISFYSIVKLINMNLADNQFTGSINSDIGFLENLRLLDLSDNQFNGELPITIGLLQYVRHIDVSSNQLTSSIPTQLLTQDTLEVLLLQNNEFDSNIADSMELLQSLRTLDVSNNNLSGAIPSSLFTLPNIESIVFTKNCFTGSIPTSICNAKSLISIDFDGLRAGRSCRKPIGNSYTSSYVHGGIPDCLFELPNLTLLHLSGNGLDGQLPQTIDISRSLRNVSLSYNRLSGPLPLVFQTFPFHKLDVSYNKISGTTTHITMNLLPIDMYPTKPTTRLIMQINRISGPLAPAFHTAANINIVSGNLYDCEFISELPINDPNTPSAVCGTQITNISFYGLLICLWAAFLVWSIYTFLDFKYTINSNTASNISIKNSYNVNKNSNNNNTYSNNDNNFNSLRNANNHNNTNSNNSNNHNNTSANTNTNQVSNQQQQHQNSKNGIFIEKIIYSFIFNRKSNNNKPSSFVYNLQKHVMTKSLYIWLNTAYDVMIKKPRDLKETTRFLNLVVEIRNFFWVVTIYIIMINLPTYLGLRYSHQGEFNTHKYQYAYIPSMAFFMGEAPAIVIFLMILGNAVLILIIMHRIQNIEPQKRKSPKFNASISSSSILRSSSSSSSYNPAILSSSSSVIASSSSSSVIASSSSSSQVLPSSSSSSSRMPPLPTPAHLPTISKRSVPPTDSRASNSNNNSSSSSSNSSNNNNRNNSSNNNNNNQNEKYAIIDISNDIVSSCIHIHTPANNDDDDDDDDDDNLDNNNNNNSNSNITGNNNYITTTTNNNNNNNTINATNAKFEDTSSLQSKLMPNIWLYLTIPTINLGVTLVVNIWYIYVILYEQRQYKLMIVTFLSIFKMIWNMLVIPAMMQTVKGAGPMFTQKLIMQMIIMIFNIVIAPVLINAIVSPDCLQHIFFPAAALEAMTEIQVCDVYDSTGDCISSSTRFITTSYNPPFMYGFQCSSSTLINYAPAYIQMYTLITIIMPLVAILMFSIMNLTITGDSTSTSNIFCCGWYRLALFLQNLKTIPPIYKNATLLGNYETVNNNLIIIPQSAETMNPIHTNYSSINNSINSDTTTNSNTANNNINNNRNNNNKNNSSNNSINNSNINNNNNNNSNNNGNRPISRYIDYEVNPEEIPHHYHHHRIRNAPKQTILNPDTILSHLMGHIMVLITFGFAYPPLAVLITFTVSVVTCQWQVLVGRYLQQISITQGKELQLLKIQIEVGCYGVSRRFFYKTKWLIICGMAGYFVFFAFDMIADKSYENPKAWLWGVLMYGLYPIPLCLISWLYDLRSKRRVSSSGSSK